MKIQFKLTAAAAALLFLTTGCRKELCYDHDLHSLACRIALAPDWEQEWERDYGTQWPTAWDAERFGLGYDDLRPATAGGLAVFVYDDVHSETPRVAKEFHIAPHGETVMVSEGDHRLLIFNDDTRNIIIDDMASLPSARATTRVRSRASYAEFHRNEETVGPPDMLYGHYQPLLTTTLNTASMPYGFTLRPLVYTYLIRYEVEEGLNYVAAARGAIAGMARNVFLTDGHTGDEPATVLYDCTVTSYGVEARVLSFGVPGFPDRYYDRSGWRVPDDGARYTLNLELLLNTTQSFTLDFDVTDQVKNQPRGGVITVTGIRIGGGGKPSGDGAFDVNVSDWGPYQDIPLN